MKIRRTVRNLLLDYKLSIIKNGGYPYPINVNAAGKIAFVPEYNFYYNRVQKNANSTLMILINKINNKKIQISDVSKSQQIGIIDMPNDKLRNLKKYRSLLIKRNPYSRVLSAFLNKFAKEKYQKKFGHFELNSVGFKKFLYWLRDGGISKNGHWDLQKKQMLISAIRYTDIISFENINEGLERFFRGVGVPAELVDLKKSSDLGSFHSTNAASKVELFYDLECVQLVSELYRADFEELGYATHTRSRASCMLVMSTSMACDTFLTCPGSLDQS